MEENPLEMAAMRGDARAFSELVCLHQQALVASAWLLTQSREDAEDLALEACLEAFRKLHTLHDEYQFRPWLFAVLRDKCYDYLRQRRPEEFSLEAHAGTLAALAPAPSPRPAELFALVEQLPLTAREVLIAHYIGEQSYAEIADVLESDEPAVRTRCLRAREQLRKLAQQREPAEESALLRSAQALVGGISTTLLSRVTSEVEASLRVQAVTGKGLMAQARARMADRHGRSQTCCLAMRRIGPRRAGAARGGAYWVLQEEDILPVAPVKPPDAATMHRLNAVKYAPGAAFRARDNMTGQSIFSYYPCRR